MEHYKVQLMINKSLVELNPFVEEFLSKISVGIVTSLKGVDYLREVQISDRDGDVLITVNQQDVAITPFPVKIISSTLRGLVSSLKGVNDVKNVDVNVEVTR
jgi:hypothetical protein